MSFFATKRKTKDWSHWWANRKIDWNTEYLQTWNHPHRTYLSSVLTRIPWMSLLEIGCGSGANLLNIIQHFKGKQVGGVDVNPEAIKLARETFNGAFLEVSSADDVLMSDNSTDVVLTDMLMLYISNPDKVIKEVKRIARNYAIFCELHSESWWHRLKVKYRDGYNIHNFRTLLEKHGFYDIMLVKIPKEVWSGEPQDTFGYIILAKVPRRK